MTSSQRSSGRTRESARPIVLSNIPKADPRGRYPSGNPSPSGLAISYDFEAPQAPPPTSSSSHHRQQMRADSMGWDDSHDIPVPRDVTNKPFVQAYDPTTNTSSRVDSVLDAYSNMYSDFAEDEEDERDAEPEPEAQRREPWDTRGKTGLYGGGGRGADDSETGWVLDYSTDSTPSHQASRGRSGEEDLRYSDPATPKSRSQDFGYGDSSDERRRSSSGTTQSSYGPATPVNSAFDPMAGYQDSSPYRPIVAKAPAPLPSRIHRPSLTPDHPVMKNNRTRASFSNGPLPPHPSSSAPSSSSRAPARQSEPTRPYDSRPPPAPPRAEFVRQPISPPRAGDTSRLQKRSPPSVNRRPSISAPIPSPPSPQRPPDTTSPRATEDVKRRKSVSAGFKFGRSKKAPTISAPILPEGFVEALGMETFALSPGCSPPDHNTSPRAKKMAKDAAPAPRPRKQQLPGAMPGSPRPNTTVGSFAPRPPPQQPKQARPATDMYRSDHPAPGPAISITPHDDHDAFRRLSQNSDTSSHAPSVAAPGEADRRQYFKGLRDDRSRQPTEVQANRGSIPNRGIAPPLNLLQRRPSTATTIGGQSSRTVYAQPPPFTQPAYQAPPAQSSGKGDSFRDPWSKGNGGNSGGVRLPVPPNNYRDNNGYSAPNESPLGQYSGSDSDRGHSASDYSLSPSPSPTAFQEDYSPTVQSNYGNGNNHNNNHAPHHGYSSSYQPQSLNVQPLNLNARRGSSATVLKAPRESVVGDVVWKGQEPSPPPVPFRKSEKIGVGSNVFRNPFEAGGGGAGGGGGQPRRHRFLKRFTPSLGMSPSWSKCISLPPLPSFSLRPSAPSYIVCTDFDGTVTTADSDARMLLELGVGPEQRQLLNKAVANGAITLKHAYQIMMSEISLRHSYEDALSIAARTLKFDPGFRSFWYWCLQSGTPLVVISSGLKDVIKAALENHLGPEASQIQVVANDVHWHTYRAGEPHIQYDFKFRHPESSEGLVKQRILDQLRSTSASLSGKSKPRCIFIGDGVSDFTAARSADLLFVKEGTGTNDLKTHCDRLRIPHRVFGNFHHILNAVGACVEGRTSLDDILYEDSLKETAVVDGWSLVS